MYTSNVTENTFSLDGDQISAPPVTSLCARLKWSTNEAVKSNVLRQLVTCTLCVSYHVVFTFYLTLNQHKAAQLPTAKQILI